MNTLVRYKRMKIFEIVSKDLEIWKYSDLFVIELWLMFA